MKNNKIFLSLLGIFLALMPTLAWAEEVHHGGGGLPQFNPESWPSQIFWLTVFFVILYTVFSKSVLPEIGQTIESRKEFIQSEIKEAEFLSTEAQALKHAIESEMKNAGHIAHSLVHAVEAHNKKHMDDSLAAFRARFEEEMIQTETRIQTAQGAVLADMQSIAAELAAAAAQKIAGIPAESSGAESVVRNLSQKIKNAA